MSVSLSLSGVFPARQPSAAGETQDCADGRFDQPVRYVDEPGLRQSELISRNICQPRQCADSQDSQHQQCSEY